ncbi:hypothetical protein EJB05_25803, partial [Eragrostis curvula]
MKKKRKEKDIALVLSDDVETCLPSREPTVLYVRIADSIDRKHSGRDSHGEKSHRVPHLGFELRADATQPMDLPSRRARLGLHSYPSDDNDVNPDETKNH